MNERLKSSQNPLFAVERLRVRWANTSQRMQRKLWWVTTITALIISIIMMLAIAYRATRVGDYYYSQTDLDVLFWLFALSLTIITLFLDFGAFLVNLSSVADDKTHLRWDLLVLAIEKDAYIRTKHQIALLRIGRVLWFNVVLE